MDVGGAYVRYSQLLSAHALIRFVVQQSTADSTDTLPSFKALVGGNVDEILVHTFAQDQIVGVESSVD